MSTCTFSAQQLGSALNSLRSWRPRNSILRAVAHNMAADFEASAGSPITFAGNASLELENIRRAVAKVKPRVTRVARVALEAHLIDPHPEAPAQSWAIRLSMCPLQTAEEKLREAFKNAQILGDTDD